MTRNSIQLGPHIRRIARRRWSGLFSYTEGDTTYLSVPSVCPRRQGQERARYHLTRCSCVVIRMNKNHMMAVQLHAAYHLVQRVRTYYFMYISAQVR